jgi:hypothetical protein
MVLMQVNIFVAIGALRKSNTHFARCGSYRIGEDPLGSRCKGKRLTVPTSTNWFSIRIAMMVLDAELHFALDR